MGKEKNKNCEKEDNKKSRPPKPKPPPQKPKPPSPPKNRVNPIQCSEEKFVCTNICGNINLEQDINELVIWKNVLTEKTTVTISVFNSAFSTENLQVLVKRRVGTPIDFNVPKGNTISATIDDVSSINVVHKEGGKVEGKFCLDICFPFRDKKSFSGKRVL